MNHPLLHDKSTVALLLDSGAKVTHSELAQRVFAAQREWQWGTHSGPKRLVFCLCKNDLPSVICYLAGLASGQVALLLPADINPSALTPLLEAYQPQSIFGASGVLNQAGYELQWQGDGYGLATRSQASNYDVHESLVLLLATSGSTGSPKLVRLSMDNIVSNAASIVSYLDIGPKERAITSLPIHYSY